jgi:hypothetical protein
LRDRIGQCGDVEWHVVGSGAHDLQGRGLAARSLAAQSRGHHRYADLVTERLVVRSAINDMGIGYMFLFFKIYKYC